MTTESMVGFGPKQVWLAVRAGETGAVRAALGLRDLGPVTWRAGVDLAYLTDDRVVLTPVLDGGWLLVTGQWLWRAGAPVADLSATLDTDVHRYASHRGLERHEWERATRGDLVRGFAYSGGTGEITRWFGDPDPTETAIGLRTRDDEVLIGESDVMRVAGVWSVDPTSLDGKPAPGPLSAAAPG